ncbi:MAG: choice-of-anchor H family protein [Pseudomonadota bacterium]
MTLSKTLWISAALLAGVVSTSALASSNETAAVSSAQGYVADKQGRDDSDALQRPASKPRAGTGQARKGGAAVSESINRDFWIYDASVALRDDLDGDGFFTRVELTFDADTVYTGASVYAVLYLSLEGGDWVEYGETDYFNIYGAGGGDEYYFDTDLVSGFPPGYYDILIELYDDFDNSLVAVYGPENDIDLFELPLESVGRDGPAAPIVVASSEGGGAAGIIGLLGLLGLLLHRQRLRISV